MAGEQFLNATLEVKRAFIRRAAAECGLRVSSEYRPDPGSFHGKNRAIDVVGPASGMAEFYRRFVPLARGRKGVRELFYDPEGAWNDFVEIPPIGGHADHVHIAFDPPPG